LAALWASAGFSLQIGDLNSSLIIGARPLTNPTCHGQGVIGQARWGHPGGLGEAEKLCPHKTFVSHLGYNRRAEFWTPCPPLTNASSRARASFKSEMERLFELFLRHWG
jgi:hypothetical protein